MPEDTPEKKKKVLDLVDQPKKSRRQRQRENAPKQESLAEKKAAALDIFSEDGGAKKTKRVKKTENSGKDQLAPISKAVSYTHLTLPTIA